MHCKYQLVRSKNDNLGYYSLYVLQLCTRRNNRFIFV